MINKSVLGSSPCLFSTFLAAKKQTVAEKRSSDLNLKTPKVKSHRTKIALSKDLAVYLITCIKEPLHNLDDLAFLTASFSFLLGHGDGFMGNYVPGFPPVLSM